MSVLWDDSELPPRYVPPAVTSCDMHGTTDWDLPTPPEWREGARLIAWVAIAVYGGIVLAASIGCWHWGIRP